MNTNRELEKYILAHTEKEDDILTELERETFLHVLNPRMVSGHLQGKILEMLSRMIAPECILEIGTFTGYSAICLSKGLGRGGTLHSIEIDDELESIAKKYIDKAGLSETVTLHTGDALQIIPGLRDTFDLVFIDGNKRQYCEYFDLVFDKVKPGGYIFADNILWNGKVVEEVSSKDGQTTSILRFNEKIKNDNRVSQVILPLRDGLMLIRKKQ